MCFLGEGADVQFPLEVLGEDSAQEAKRLHSVDWGVTQGDGVSGIVFFLKSTTISTVLRALSSKLFWLHQVVSFPAVIRLVPVRDEPNEGGVVRQLRV